MNTNSVKLVEAVLYNYFQFQQSLVSDLMEAMRTDGSSPFPMSPNNTEVTERAARYKAYVVAKNLVAGDRSVPIFSDYAEKTSAHVTDVNLADDSSLSLEVKELLRKPVESMMIGAMSALTATLDTDLDYYDLYERAVNSVMFVSAKYDVSPCQPLSVEQYYEVTRLLYTKEEFLEQARKELQTISDPSAVAATLAKAMVSEAIGNDTLGIFSESDRGDLEASLMSSLLPVMEYMEVLSNRLINDQVALVYPD